MTKLKKTEEGFYKIAGKVYESLKGTRRQVYDYQSAYKTAGGLTKKDLVKNKAGRIVSKKKYSDGPKLLKNLTSRGFFTKKGQFGAMRKTKKNKIEKFVGKKKKHGKNKNKGGAYTGVVNVNGSIDSESPSAPPASSMPSMSSMFGTLKNASASASAAAAASPESKKSMMDAAATAAMAAANPTGTAKNLASKGLEEANKIAEKCHVKEVPKDNEDIKAKIHCIEDTIVQDMKEQAHKLEKMGIPQKTIDNTIDKVNSQFNSMVMTKIDQAIDSKKEEINKILTAAQIAKSVKDGKGLDDESATKIVTLMITKVDTTGGPFSAMGPFGPAGPLVKDLVKKQAVGILTGNH